MPALSRLRRDLALAGRTLPMIRVSGTVSEIAPALYRVSGLSRFVNLGETVTLVAEGGPQIGEVIRIDDGAVTVKPFDANVQRRHRHEVVPLRAPPAFSRMRAGRGAC